MTFLNDLDATFKDPLSNSPILFAYRFEIVNEKTNIEITQYGDYAMLFSITLTLDGDSETIQSFLRAFNLWQFDYSFLSDVSKKLQGLSPEEIASQYDVIHDEVWDFRKRLIELNNRAKKLYKDKKVYYDHIEFEAQQRTHVDNTLKPKDITFEI